MEDPIVYPTPSQLLNTAPPKSTSNPDDGDDEDKPDTAPHKKKKAPPTKKKASVQHDTRIVADGIMKPKQTKSRTGCQICKDKRLKCDETKPACENCKRRNVKCPGYKTNFQFRDLTVTLHQHGGAKPNAKPTAQAKKARTAASVTSVRTPSVQESNGTAELSPEGSRDATCDVGPAQEMDTTPSDHAGVASSPLSPLDPALAPAVDEGQAGWSAANDARLTPPLSMTGSPNHGTRSRSVPAVLSEDTTARLPGVSDLLEGIDPNSLWASTNNDEEITRALLHVNPVPSSSLDVIPASSLSMSSGNVAALVQDVPMSYLPHEPSFDIASLENMTRHFDQLTCGILSVKDGPTENPWRTVLWPMAQESEAVMHSVCALAAFHGSRHDSRLLDVGNFHNDRAIANLHEGLRDDSIGRETRLAASLALGFADGWHYHITSGVMHIRGARTMIRQALEEHNQTPLTGLRLDRLKFLCNAWVYMDVIARLTSTDDDETDEYERIYWSFGNPHAHHNGFGIDFGMPIDAQLDPLMGCASTLFPLIGRTANLARRVRRSESNSPAIITQALELKEQLEMWEPPDFIEEPEDPTSTVPHALQTARAYQFATLLHLHQTVPEIPSATSAQMAKKILQLLATVPAQSRFLIVHIFPLMAAGCEAVNNEDRQWVRDRWNAMGRRLQIGSIDKCLEVTEEVWKRRDEQPLLPRRPLVPTANAHEIAFPRQHRSERSDSMDLRPAGLGLSNYHPTMDTDAGGLFPMIMSRPSWPQVKEWNDEMNAQYNVNGRLHWLGVMNDWNWEALLHASTRLSLPGNTASESRARRTTRGGRDPGPLQHHLIFERLSPYQQETSNDFPHTSPTTSYLGMIVTISMTVEQPWFPCDIWGDDAPVLDRKRARVLTQLLRPCNLTRLDRRDE